MSTKANPQNDENNQTSSTDNSSPDLQNELNQMKDIAQRAMADLQNYKRKAEEERSTLLQMGQVQVITEVLPVLDNFSRALQHTPAELKDNNWTQGIIQIEKQLQQILTAVGVTPIESVGKAVDPNLHEVIGTTEGETDIIVVETEKGYTYKGKLLRPSKVLVGK